LDPRKGTTRDPQFCVSQANKINGGAMEKKKNPILRDGLLLFVVAATTQ